MTTSIIWDHSAERSGQPRSRTTARKTGRRDGHTRPGQALCGYCPSSFMRHNIPILFWVRLMLSDGLYQGLLEASTDSSVALGREPGLDDLGVGAGILR